MLTIVLMLLLLIACFGMLAGLVWFSARLIEPEALP